MYSPLALPPPCSALPVVICKVSALNLLLPPYASKIKDLSSRTGLLCIQIRKEKVKKKNYWSVEKSVIQRIWHALYIESGLPSDFKSNFTMSLQLRTGFWTWLIKISNIKILPNVFAWHSHTLKSNLHHNSTPNYTYIYIFQSPCLQYPQLSLLLLKISSHLYLLIYCKM